MKVLCTICARGGSKGVPNKNIRQILGKPLIVWTIEQALNANLFDKVIVSSDSEQIMKIAREHGAEVFFKRDPILSGDEVGKIEVIRDALLRSENFFGTTFNVVVDLDVTAPLRTSYDIIRAFEAFINNDYDILFSVTPSRRNPYFNMVEIDQNGKVRLCKIPNQVIKRRQDAPRVYDMNASIYIWKRDVLINYNTLFLEKTGVYIMGEESAFDIDTEIDLLIVECIMKKIHNVIER